VVVTQVRRARIRLCLSRPGEARERRRSRSGRGSGDQTLPS